MKDDRSEARNTMPSAISSTVPKRPIGIAVADVVLELVAPAHLDLEAAR